MTRNHEQEKPFQNETTEVKMSLMNETESVCRVVENFFRLITSEFLIHDCKVQTDQAGNRIALVVEPHPNDVGKLIGKDKVMLHSTIGLLSQLSQKNEVQYHYQIKTRNKGDGTRQPEFVSREDWPMVRLEKLFKSICDNLFEKPFSLKMVNIVGKGNPPRTNFYLSLSPEEPKRVTDAELQDGLSQVFHRIGKANGRLIFLDGLERNGNES